MNEGIALRVFESCMVKAGVRIVYRAPHPVEEFLGALGFGFTTYRVERNGRIAGCGFRDDQEDDEALGWQMAAEVIERLDTL